MIKVKAKKTYSKKVVLDVDATFEEGKIYCIVGQNGCGKSTFLNILANQIKYEGEVSLETKDIVYSPQNAYAFSLSVLKNILLGSKKTPDRESDAVNLITRIGLGEFTNTNATKLSGGEKQKMVLVRTLLQKHSIVLLDEPTSSMDVFSTSRAENIIKTYQEENHSTIFVVTHSINQAKRIGDEIIFINEGKIVERGYNILVQPKTALFQEFLDNN